MKRKKKMFQLPLVSPFLKIKEGLLERVLEIKWPKLNHG